MTSACKARPRVSTMRSHSERAMTNGGHSAIVVPKRRPPPARPTMTPWSRQKSTTPPIWAGSSCSLDDRSFTNSTPINNPLPRDSVAPVTLDDRTELWHTRLAVRTQHTSGFVADETTPRRLRAVWSPDYSPGSIPPHPVPPFTQVNAPFRMSLDPDDRDQIVRLSSDFT